MHLDTDVTSGKAGLMDPLTGLFIVLSQDKGTVAAADFYGNARVWDIKTKQMIWEQMGAKTCLGFTAWPAPITLAPDGKTAALFGASGLSLVNITSRTDISNFGGAKPPLAFSPNGQWLATAETSIPNNLNELGDMNYWEPTKAVHLFAVHGDEAEKTLPHGAIITALAFSADSKLLASVGEDGTVKCWSIPAGQLLHTFSPSKHGGFSGVLFSPDGQQLAFSGTFQGVTLWDTRTWQCIRTLPDVSGLLPFLRTAVCSSDIRMMVGCASGISPPVSAVYR